MTRYRRGKSLQELFQHFLNKNNSNNNNGYFDAKDFSAATAELRLETSSKVANIAVAQIAIDGGDKVQQYNNNNAITTPHSSQILQKQVQK